LDYLKTIEAVKSQTYIKLQKINYKTPLENKNSFYIGLYSNSQSWQSADVYQSNDNFQTSTKILNLVTKSIFGSVLEFKNFPSINNNLIDLLSSITISFDSDYANSTPPSSATIVINGEILRYNQITNLNRIVNGKNTYKITILEREMFNTNQIINKTPSEFLVTEVKSINYALQKTTIDKFMLIDQSKISLKAVANNDSIFAVKQEDFTF
jgi:hypothetical protein